MNEKFTYSYKELGMLFKTRGDMKSAKEYFEDYIKLDVAEDEIKSINNILDRINK